MNKKEIKKLTKAIELITEVTSEIQSLETIKILKTNHKMLLELYSQVKKIMELEEEISKLKEVSIIENLKIHSGKTIAAAYNLTAGRISQIKKAYKKGF